MGPSAIPRHELFVVNPGKGDIPRELTISEIQDIVTRFAQAAERAQKAGFSGVELHGASSYLIAQFLSSAANKRQDIYGGELKNRARLLLEIIRACREAVGENYPLWCRLNAREVGIQDGTTLEEALQVSRMAEKAGSDAIHVVAFGSRPLKPGAYPRGNLLPLAEAVKNVVDVPVIAVGRIDPELGEMALQASKADFIGMGRALIADPELPNKAASGKLKDIKLCLSCDKCISHVLMEGVLRCAVNTAAGRELEHAGKKIKVTKKDAGNRGEAKSGGNGHSK